MIVQLGASGPGGQGEIRHRCCEMVGVSDKPAGLDWGDTESLDAAMTELGCDLRLLGPLIDESSERLADFLDEIDRGVYSWTWQIDERARRDAVAVVRPWAEERWGPLDQEVKLTYETFWRAYDVKA